MKHGFCLLLAVIMLLSLAACGNGATPTDPSGTISDQLNSQPATDTPTDAPIEPPTEAPTEPAIIYILATKTRTKDGVVDDYEEYDNQGRLIKEIEGAAGSTGGYTNVYTYDKNGADLICRSEIGRISCPFRGIFAFFEKIDFAR